MLMSFTSCGRNVKYTEQNGINLNYNNISASDTTFWLTEDTLYYSSHKFLTPKFYSITKDGEKTIPTTEGNVGGHICAFGEYLYIPEDIENVSPIKTIYKLRKYSVADEKDERCWEIENLVSFFALNDVLYYIQNNQDDNGTFSLFAVSTNGDDKFEIANDIFTFGVMDDYLVYIIRQGDEFSIYSFDAEKSKSELIANFNYKFSENEVLESSVNFTSNKVILTVTSETNSKILVYNTDNKEIIEYEQSGYLYSLIAYKNYAFLVIVPQPEDDTSNQNNIIYRISLQDGTTEKVTEIKGIVDQFVTSDEFVYLTTTEDDYLYRFEVDGKKSIVCKF